MFRTYCYKSIANYFTLKLELSSSRGRESLICWGGSVVLAERSTECLKTVGEGVSGEIGAESVPPSNAYRPEGIWPLNPEWVGRKARRQIFGALKPKPFC